MTTAAASVPEAPRRSATSAARVRGLLAERGMTYEGLGLALGLSKAAISDRLRGRTKIDIDELDALASTLGSSVEYLLGLTDDRSPRRVTVEGLAGARYAIRDSNPEPADYPSVSRRGHLRSVPPVKAPAARRTATGAVVLPFRSAS